MKKKNRKRSDVKTVKDKGRYGHKKMTRIMVIKSKKKRKREKGVPYVFKR